VYRNDGTKYNVPGYCPPNAVAKADNVIKMQASPADIT